MQTTGLKPGQPAPVSGRYRQIGPRGGKGSARTVVCGEPLPSTSKPGATYTLMRRGPNRDSGRPPENRAKLVLLTKKGRPMPGVDFDSRARLYDLMDGLD